MIKEADKSIDTEATMAMQLYPKGIPRTLEILEEHDQRMRPGTSYIFKPPQKYKDDVVIIGVIACPICGFKFYFNEREADGLIPIICQGDDCSAEYVLEGCIDGAQIVYRKPQ